MHGGRPTAGASSTSTPPSLSSSTWPPCPRWTARNSPTATQPTTGPPHQELPTIPTMQPPPPPSSRRMKQPRKSTTRRPPSAHWLTGTIYAYPYGPKQPNTPPWPGLSSSHDQGRQSHDREGPHQNYRRYISAARQGCHLPLDPHPPRRYLHRQCLIRWLQARRDNPAVSQK